MCDGFSRVCFALIVEQHRRHFDVHVLARLGERVEGEEAVLTVQHAQDPVLFWNLEQAEVVLAGHRREREPLLRRDDDGAGNGGKRRRVLALPVVGDQLVNLATDHRPLVRRLAFADPLLEHVPVDARPVHARFLRRLVRRAARVAQDLELH